MSGRSEGREKGRGGEKGGKGRGRTPTAFWTNRILASARLVFDVVADTFQRMNASEGLSSVASFSLGLSMSMRGSPVTDEADKTGGHAHVCTGPPPNALRRPIPAPRKPSFQDLFPVQPPAVSSGGVTKPAAGSTLAARRRRSSIDPTKLARLFPIKASGFLGRRLSRFCS